MKAIILAAGLGSRLKSITNNKPKALVEVNGIPMLEMVIQNLKNQGIHEFLINIHHFGQSIIDFLTKNNNFDVNITISDERNKLLDTGGAILKAHSFIQGGEPTLVHNVDIISSIKIDDLLNNHIEYNSIATLCVRKRNSGRGLLFNDNMHLLGWTNIEKQNYKWVNNTFNDYNIFAFSGIYLISPDFTKQIKQKGKFSIIDTWLEIAKNNTITGFIDTSDRWHDLGTADKINIVESR